MKQLSPFALLKKHRVSTKKWGKDNFSKTLNHLREEIRKNECKLIFKNGELIRKSRAVKVSIHHMINSELHILIEEKQVFKNGTIRYRGVHGKHCLPAEKLFLKEEPKTGLKRLFEEELQIKNKKLLKDSLLIGPEEGVKERKESTTYPGLISERIMYHYEVRLPVELYKNEYKEVQGNYTTYFKWVKLYQNDQD